MCGLVYEVFFFPSRRRHTRSTRDWSSDVCSSDLRARGGIRGRAPDARRERGGGLIVALEPRLRPAVAEGGNRLRLASGLDERQMAHAARRARDEGTPKRRGGETVADRRVTPARLELARGHRLECHHQIVQPPGTGEPDAVGRIEHGGVIDEGAARGPPGDERQVLPGGDGGPPPE